MMHAQPPLSVSRPLLPVASRKKVEVQSLNLLESWEHLYY